MMTIDHWNAMQIRVFKRYGRRHRALLTPELVTLLAHRFALKHVRAIADGRSSEPPEPTPPPPPSAPARARRVVTLSDLGPTMRRCRIEVPRAPELCVSAASAA